MDNNALNVTKKNINSFQIPGCYQGYLQDLYISEGEIQSRMEKVALDVVNHYKSQDFTILVVLKGSCFINDILQQKLRQIYSFQDNYRPFVITQYIKCQSYTNEKSNNNVEIQNINDKHIKDKNILVVEDIVDTGHTLLKLTDKLNEMGAKSIEYLSLIKKLDVPCAFQQHIRFLAFTGPNVFYVGAGLDYNQYFRDLQHLCSINQIGIDKFKI